MLQPQWYNGVENIHRLNIISPSLKIIETDAFNWPAFEELETLSIAAESPVEYRNITKGLNRVASLRLEATYSGGRVGHILLSLRKTLVQFHYSCKFGSTKIANLNVLFGNVKMSKLKNLDLVYLERSEESNGAVLAKRDFTGLVALRELHLVRCGIVAIDDGTFDFIGETLRCIDLSGNRLTTLTADLFLTFLDSDANSFHVRKWLSLMENPLHCNYEFYKLRNMTFVSLDFIFGNQYSMQCDQSVPAENILMVNRPDDLQLIHADRWHLKYIDNDVYAYPNFQLKYDVKTVTLTIKHSQTGQFRLLIMGQNSKHNKLYRKCPSRWIILSAVNCVIHKNATDNIQLAEYLIRNELTTFCVIYISVNRRVWPLHCATIRQPPHNSPRSYIWSEIPIRVLIWFVSSIVGATFGLIVAPFAAVQQLDGIKPYVKPVFHYYFLSLLINIFTIFRDFRKISSSTSYDEDCGYICCIEGEPQNNDYLQVDYYEEVGKSVEEQPSMV